MDNDSDDLIHTKKKGAQKKEKETKGGKKKQQQEEQKEQVQEKEQNTSNQANKNQIQPKQVLYCLICSLPPEYCHLGKTFAECRAWLEKTDPEMFQSLYANFVEEVKEQVEEQKEEQKQEPILDDAQKQQQEPEKKKTKKVKVKEPQNVVKITVKQRMKEKFLTHIAGLDKFGTQQNKDLYFGIDLKEVQKKFSKKFGCGASVSNNMIEIQGDFSYDLSEWLPKEYAQLTEDMIEIKEL